MANFDVLDNRRPDSDVATVAHAYAAAQYRSRCNVHVIADHAVVIDLGASIDNGIIAETATRLHDGSRHYLHTFAEAGFCTDDR